MPSATPTNKSGKARFVSVLLASCTIFFCDAPFTVFKYGSVSFFTPQNTILRGPVARRKIALRQPNAKCIFD
jgi:hypothetical protein